MSDEPEIPDDVYWSQEYEQARLAAYLGAGRPETQQRGLRFDKALWGEAEAVARLLDPNSIDLFSPPHDLASAKGCGGSAAAASMRTGSWRAPPRGKRCWPRPSR